jgi:hypothetical protein
MLRVLVMVLALAPQPVLAGGLSPIFGSEGTPPLQLAMDAAGQPVTATAAAAPAVPAPAVTVIHVPAPANTAAR